MLFVIFFIAVFTLSPLEAYSREPRFIKSMSVSVDKGDRPTRAEECYRDFKGQLVGGVCVRYYGLEYLEIPVVLDDEGETVATNDVDDVIEFCKARGGKAWMPDVWNCYLGAHLHAELPQVFNPPYRVYMPVNIVSSTGLNLVRYIANGKPINTSPIVALALAKEADSAITCLTLEFDNGNIRVEANTECPQRNDVSIVCEFPLLADALSKSDNDKFSKFK